MVVHAETERVIRRVLGDVLPKFNEMQRDRSRVVLQMHWGTVVLHMSMRSQEKKRKALRECRIIDRWG